jgi:hypothetical protein
MSFLEGEIVILGSSAKNGLPDRIGERGVILITDEFSSPNYDYVLEFDDRLTAPVREREIFKLDEEDKEAMEFIFTGNKVIYSSREKAVIKKVDYINKRAEIYFIGGGSEVVEFEKLKPLEVENKKEEITERNFDGLLNILFKHYKNENDTYTLPKQLLINLLDQIFEE